MANLRLLSTETKKNKRKDSHNRWIKFENPLTNEVDEPHYDISCFEGNYYKYFFQENNRIVNLATQYEIDLGKSYDDFMKIGMKLSQQLNGKIRDKTEQIYYQKSKELKELLLQKCRTKFEQDEKIVYQNTLKNLEGKIAEEDLKQMYSIISNLQPLDIPKKISPSKRERSIENRILGMNSETNTNFVEYVSQVPKEVKAPFFDLMTYHRQKGDKDFSCFAEEISSTLSLIGIENGKTYLEMLKTVPDKNLYDEIIFMKNNAEQETPEKISSFFQTWEKTRDLKKAYEVLWD